LTPGGSITYTFTHKQYTEYRQRNIHNNKKKFEKCGPCPFFGSYTLAFALQLRKKHGKPPSWVAAPTSQADTVQYKNNKQDNTQKKNSNREYYNDAEQYSIH
jgi:hypothetical protein